MTRKEQIIDVAKDVLMWVVVTGLAFAYWLVVLLIFSLLLLNVWHTSFEAIVHYAVILMIITSILYLVRIIYKRYKTEE